ncbi:hypothetical protein IE53DRAFT_28277 [Violaceomyces palustris]|uniref:Uncharacterized protein n=1 Tax=Violaceomyces palustris TaxID=1673888 RepID=A0ACD0P1I1_9BASI|nr:hypothetical protein IE53DRAFT_28277 [Violaceomyces palustris]
MEGVEDRGEAQGYHQLERAGSHDAGSLRAGHAYSTGRCGLQLEHIHPRYSMWRGNQGAEAREGKPTGIGFKERLYLSTLVFQYLWLRQVSISSGSPRLIRDEEREGWNQVTGGEEDLCGVGEELSFLFFFFFTRSRVPFASYAREDGSLIFFLSSIILHSDFQQRCRRGRWEGWKEN